MHRLQYIDNTRRISISSKSPGCYGGFENRAEFSTAHPVFSKQLLVLVVIVVFNHLPSTLVGSVVIFFAKT